MTELPVKAAAELTCACGHLLDDHARPTSTREPWGRCRVSVAPVNPGPMTRCDCSEAWPLEEDPQ